MSHDGTNMKLELPTYVEDSLYDTHFKQGLGCTKGNLKKGAVNDMTTFREMMAIS